MNNDVYIYRIYIDLVEPTKSTSDDKLNKLKGKYEKEGLGVDSISNEEEISEKLFFGKKSPHLSPVVPFKWIGRVLTIGHKKNKKNKKNECHIVSHALLFNNTIEVKIAKYKRNNKSLLISNCNKELTKKIENVKLRRKSQHLDQTLEVIDIKWDKWEVNYPKDNTILSWLFRGADGKPVKFGNMWSYEKIGLWDKEAQKIVNLSTLSKCFLSCSNRRVLIIRCESVKDKDITFPGIEIVCWAGIGLIGASLLIEELDNIEDELKNLFEAVTQKKEEPKKKEGIKKEEGIKKGEVIQKTSEVIKKLGEVYRRSSIIQKFFSGYPIPAASAGLIMETFSRLSGAVGMTKALQEKLENAYRLYQLYQQYYYFKEMETLEEAVTKQ